MPIIIQGFGSDNRVPGFFAETRYGLGRLTSSGGLVVLLMGGMTSAGDATPDTEVYSIPDLDTAIARFGARSELTHMCEAALEVEGVTIQAIAITEAGGAASAELDMTITGSWTESAEFSWWLAGRKFSTTIAAGWSVTQAAAAIVAATNADATLPILAANLAGVVTFTVQSKGVRGNDYICVNDPELTGPSGFVATLSGGTALTGGATPFASGSGTDDITAALATLETDQYDRIACAANDATNADRLRDAVNSKAGPTKGFLEHFVFAKTRGQSAAISFSQTDLNEYRGQVYHFENSETHPAAIAAWIAAYRAATEGTDPNPNYDDVEVAIATPQKFKADWPTHDEQKLMLNSGVSPLKTTTDGRVTIVRAITAHSLNGAAADYRTYDVGDAVVPDRIRTEIGLYWLGTWRVSNPDVAADPAQDDRPRPAGVGTPSLWRADLISNVLRPAESNRWIMDVDDNLPIAEWDAVAKRIMSATPVVVQPKQHQMGVSVRQISAS